MQALLRSKLCTEEGSAVSAQGTLRVGSKAEAGLWKGKVGQAAAKVLPELSAPVPHTGMWRGQNTEI